MDGNLKELGLVDKASALDELIAYLRDARLLAMDTEFVRERTYYPELCLLQIATDRVIAAVDCLAPLDLTALSDTLLGPERVWVMHSARQDLEVISNLTGRLPEKLIDTQIAAGLVGMPLQTGLQSLLESALGIAITKQHTRANWSRRPLKPEYLGYALDDVRYLLAVWKYLEDKLRDLDRLAWMEEDSARLLAIPIAPEPISLFEKTKGTGTLKGRARAAALGLIEWREQRARTRDKPRRWILADDALVRIATALPESIADLKDIPGLPRRLVEGSGQALIDATRDTQAPPETIDSVVPEKARVKALQAAVRSKAAMLGIQPELLATRREIAAVATGRCPEILSDGWRRDVVEDLIDDVNAS